MNDKQRKAMFAKKHGENKRYKRPAGKPKSAVYGFQYGVAPLPKDSFVILPDDATQRQQMVRKVGNRGDLVTSANGTWVLLRGDKLLAHDQSWRNHGPGFPERMATKATHQAAGHP